MVNAQINSRLQFSAQLLALAGFAIVASAQPIANGRALNAWAHGAANGRADIVMLGDSNQLYAGFGYNGGFINAVRTSPGLYATGLLWAGEGSGLGAGDGEGYSNISVGTNSAFSFDSAPEEAAVFGRFITPMSQYLYLPSGSITGARNMGVTLSGALDASAALRWRLTDVTFPSEGSYRCNVRLGQAPFSTVITFQPSTTGGGYGLRTQTFDIPAGTRTGNLELRYAAFSFSPVITAPMLLLWNRIEQVGRTGVSVHTLYAWGGKSARQMAFTMSTASDEMLSAWFTQVRALQGASPKVLVRINQGLNDTSETLPSVGRGLLPGNTPQAFADNIDVTIRRVNAIWDLNQWPREELTFAVSVAHAIGTPGSPEQNAIDAYRDAAAGLMADHRNLAVVDMSALISHAEMIARSYYVPGNPGQPAEFFHLSRLGYEQLSILETQMYLNPPCPGDFNEDGGVDGPDIEAFIMLWETGSVFADLNADGGTDGGDVEAFFVAWETGC